MNLFSRINNLNNLYESWKEFRKGKRKKTDVCQFERHLEDNLFDLHFKLKTKKYRHTNYSSFYISDPKCRHIHKACVRDRLIHHAVHRIIYPIFDRGFIENSYSCRVGKGTHKAIRKLEEFIWKNTNNYGWPCWALKCDIKKFFDSVDHQILFKLIQNKIGDKETLSLIWNIISSFRSETERERERE